MKKLFNFKKHVQVIEYGREIEKDILDIPKIVVFSIIGLFIFITLLNSFATIKSGEVGLKVRFGKIVNSKLDEGINFKIPYIEGIKKVNIKVQKVETRASSASKDLQDVTLTLAVNYRVDGTKATDLYKNVGNKYEEIVLQPAIQESIKAVTSQYTAEELITNRSEVSKKCKDVLQEKIYKYGLVIDNFNITNFNFSAEFNKAIEEKQVAEQKVLTAKQELEKAKVEAERKIVEADATKKANELLKQTLTDEVIAKQFIEKWNGVLPTTYAGNDLLKLFNIN